jgi:hypothetical protein
MTFSVIARCLPKNTQSRKELYILILDVDVQQNHPGYRGTTPRIMMPNQLIEELIDTP